jgi:hypothetical protein
MIQMDMHLHMRMCNNMYMCCACAPSLLDISQNGLAESPHAHLHDACTSPVEVLPDAQPLVQVEAVEKANPLDRQRCAHATLVDVAAKAQAAARDVCAEALRRRGDGLVLQEG